VNKEGRPSTVNMQIYSELYKDYGGNLVTIKRID